jgi:hypothetical protein
MRPSYRFEGVSDEVLSRRKPLQTDRIQPIVPGPVAKRFLLKRLKQRC